MTSAEMLQVKRTVTSVDNMMLSRTIPNVGLHSQPKFLTDYHVTMLIAYLPTPKLRFQEQKSQKSETQQQTYPYIYEKNPVTRFYKKITGQSTLCTSLTNSAQLRTLFADHA